MNETALTTGNWAALLKLELRRVGDSTRLVPLQRYGPLTVQRPFYPEPDCCHVYLLHPPGGVVGGDTIDLMVNMKPGSRGLFTMPGAAKYYLSAGDTARVNQQFEVADGAQMEYLPQENIYFPGALVDSRTAIDVEPGASLLLWEKHCFGRPANREAFDRGLLRARIDLRSAGQLIYAEVQRIDAAEIERPSGLRGYPVCGTLLAYGGGLTDEAVGVIQQLAPERGIAGATRVQPDLLIARYIGPSTADLDRYFNLLWERLRPLLLRREACRPRIWNT